MPERSPDERKQQTDEHLTNPQVGDRFTEMFAFWVVVISVEPGEIKVLEFRSDKTVTGVIFADSKELRKKYAYGGRPGYWIDYMNTEPLKELPEVDSWLIAREHFEKREDEARRRGTGRAAHLLDRRV
jgi:hypothetical protein